VFDNNDRFVESAINRGGLELSMKALKSMVEMQFAGFRHGQVLNQIINKSWAENPLPGWGPKCRRSRPENAHRCGNGCRTFSLPIDEAWFFHTQWIMKSSIPSIR